MKSKSKARDEIRKALVFQRSKHGKTLKEVSDYLDIKETSYRAYEDGRAEPRITILKQISIFYGMKTVEELVNFKDILQHD